MIVAIIQARMGSTRLPGKVLKDIGGRTMLARVVRRVRRATILHRIVVATTVESADDAIVAECKRLAAPVFRGSEQDVLDRYYWAAKMYEADTIVRITADCPLIDPEIIDRVVQAFLDKKPDYASNTLVRTYPRGLDTEVMSWVALARTWVESPSREHVTSYIYENSSSFRLHIVIAGEWDYSHHRWTVDTQEDIDNVRAIYARFNNEDTFGWRDALL